MPASSENDQPLRLLVLVSGGGTNLQALIDAEGAGSLGGSFVLDGRDSPANAGGASRSRARIVGVVSDRPGVYALERAQAARIPSFVEAVDRYLPKADRRRDLSDRIFARARSLSADAIVLAGFLSILEGPIVDAYANRMINLHPALLPKFGGPGMFGEHVHAAVLAAREKESGCTVHLVDAGTDTGPILLQRRVAVLPGDTPDSLAERIHVEEHIAMVQAIAILVDHLK